MSKISDINLDKIVSDFRKISRSSVNEEEFKINAERIIYDDIVSVLGLEMGRYEYSLVSGARMDALYGHVIIEYKAPGVLSTPSGFAKAKKQLIDYILQEAGVKERFKYFFGIILSDKIVFVKFDTILDKWSVRGPYDINREVILKIVEALRGLRKKRLSAEELLRDFGPKSELALNAINVIYDKLEQAKSPKTALLFEDWVRIFSQITGYKEEDLKGLDEFYDTRGKNYTKLLFCIHTYYALLMKLIAAELAYLYGAGRYLKSYVAELEDNYMKGVNEFKNSLKDLEEGGLFSRLLKIRNFIEGSYFSWYLEEFDKNLMDVVAEIAKKLSDYEPATPVLEPEETKDMLKIIYQELVPKPIRHNLGEYYTPDWLAQLLLNRVGFSLEYFEEIAEKSGDPTKPLELRLLDPACGSGTFIIEALKRLRSYAEKHFITDMLPDYVLNNIVGIDLNPLAVLAARTNYLLNVGDLLSYASEVELPVYLADSVTIEKSGGLYGVVYKVKTSAGEFGIPSSIIDEKRSLGEVLNLVEECVRLTYSPEEFENRVTNTHLDINSLELETLKSQLYEPLLDLEREGKDHVWVTILRNAFAPLFIGKFDYVVGNPPWVLWDNLPTDYRDSTQKLWKQYGLFTLTASQARYGGGKKDISILFTYVCCDKYLKDSGTFGFLITQSVFKTKGAGEGFRRFKLNGVNLKVIEAHDLVEVQPFEGANNRTAAIILKKGEETKFPIKYTLWRKLYDIDQKESLNTVSKKLHEIEMMAIPSDPDNDLSPWITVPPNVVEIVKRVYGRNAYPAYAGIYSGGANGVYWVKISEVLKESKKMIEVPNSLKTVLGIENEIIIRELLVENVTEGMKKKIRKVEAVIEDFFIYPLLKSKNVKKWRIEGYNYALQMQNPIKRIGYDRGWVKVNFPKTYAYLKGFEKELKERKSGVVRQLLAKGPFYSMYAVGEYTYSPYKVVWNRMGGKISSCVVSKIKDEYLGEKLILPENVLAFIPTNNEDEAHYICAIMNSSIIDMVLRSIAGGTKSFGTPKIIEDTIRIPEFDPNNDIHRKLSELSNEAHKLAQEAKDVSSIEEEIDALVAELYGISEEEMEKVKRTISIQEGEIPEEEEVEEEEVKEEKPSVAFMNTVLEPEKPGEIEVILTNPPRVPLELVIDFLGEEHSFKTSDTEKTFRIGIKPLEKGNYKLTYRIIGLAEEISDAITIHVKTQKKHRKSRLAKKFDDLLEDEG